MAKIKIQGNASGTGVFTVTAPNTSTDRTITLPDSTGTILDNTSTLDATKLSGTLPALNGASLTSVNAVNGGRKNMVINGAMQVSQRGDYESVATNTVTVTYYFDRFFTYAATMAATFQVVPATINGGSYKSLKMTATNTATGEMVFMQKIEDQNLVLGKEYTFSVWVKSSTTSVAPRIYDGVSYSSGASHSGGGGWEKLTASFTTLTSANGWYVIQMFNNSQTTGDVWEFALPQLELGSVATDFEHRSYGEELALCKRYYERWNSSSSLEALIGVGYCLSGTRVLAHYKYDVTKRAHPTGTNSGASDFQCLKGSWVSATGFDFIANNHTARLNLTGLSGFTGNAACEVKAIAGAGKWFAFDAEL